MNLWECVSLPGQWAKALKRAVALIRINVSFGFNCNRYVLNILFKYLYIFELYYKECQYLLYATGRIVP